MESQVVMRPMLIHNGDIVFRMKVKRYWKNEWLLTLKIDIQLHACYINMGSGSFIAKEMASKFISKYDANEYADIYFTIYMNQIPYQLEGHGSLKKTLGVKEIEHMV